MQKPLPFLLQILEAIECDSCKNDEALEHKLEVRVDTKECKAVSKRGEDYNTDYSTAYLSDTTIE